MRVGLSRQPQGAAMSPLAAAIGPFIKKGLRFRSVTTQELRASLDVYALEIARWKAPAGAGMDFALITGDFNPVHWVPAYARLPKRLHTMMNCEPNLVWRKRKATANCSCN